jgi:cation diffusion facilitator CzcD-associated flavoprotein CzcO
VRDLATGEAIVDTADFVVNSQGRISDPKWPAIPGLRDTYRGTVVHTARWPQEGVDLAGKRVAVIGNGASAQQLVPNIIGEVRGIDHYVVDISSPTSLQASKTRHPPLPLKPTKLSRCVQ